MGCTCAGHAGNVFPAGDFKGNHKLVIPVCITACISIGGKTLPTFTAHAQPANHLRIWQEAHSTIVFCCRRKCDSLQLLFRTNGTPGGGSESQVFTFNGEQRGKAWERSLFYIGALKRKYRHFDEISVIGRTGSYHLTTYGTTSKEIFVKMTTFSFACDAFILIKDSAADSVKSSALAMELSHSCDIHVIVE